MYYTYVFKSEKDGNIYVGWTVDVQYRLKEHNAGHVKATCHRMPFQLVYYEACLSEEAAIRREKQLKTGFGRAYLRKRLGP